MKAITQVLSALLILSHSFLIIGCASLNSEREHEEIVLNSSSDSSSPSPSPQPQRFEQNYATRLPSTLDTSGKKTILVNPNVHAWGAYDSDGRLLRAGIATAGGIKCPPDAGSPSCRTGIGTFHIQSLGDSGCFSSIYPKPNGGGLMPFCMFFNNGQALHGSPDPIVIEDNVSHGCVRLRITDAEWLRYNFAQVGTKVVVLPY